MILLQAVEASAEAAASLNYHTMNNLLFLLLLAILNAAFSCFLDYLLEDHPAGIWYLKQIQKLPIAWAKPLGECPYCSGAWQWLIVSFLIFDYPIYLCLIFLGANHFSLLLLHKWQRKIIKKNLLNNL